MKFIKLKNLFYVSRLPIALGISIMYLTYKLRVKNNIEKEDIIKLNVMPKEYGPGIEDSCKWVFDNVSPMITEKTNGRVWLDCVRVYEHENNWAQYFRTEKIFSENRL